MAICHLDCVIVIDIAYVFVFYKTHGVMAPTTH